MPRTFDCQRAQREVARVLRANKESGVRQETPHIVRVLEGMAVNDACSRDLIRSLGALLGDRWTTLIVHVLRDGPFRYGVLHRLIGAVSDVDAISQRMLSLRLRALEREGLVERIVARDHSPNVQYGLTQFGVAFSEQAGAFSSWVASHMSHIKSARDRFDASALSAHREENCGGGKVA